jgi:Fe-S cluster assembly protein SufD
MKPTFIHVTETPTKPFSFDKKGTYVVFFHNVSGTYTFELEATGVELYILGLFTGKDKNEYKIETIQHHKAPGAYSDLFIKGVFDDASRFEYEGLIRIEKEGQQSHAYQKNQNLILSKGVFVQSNPFLEILANDVFCTHGSTTGKLNKEEIFYVKSRGLSEKDAKNVLVEGFAREVVDKLKEKIPSFDDSFIKI